MGVPNWKNAWKIWKKPNESQKYLSQLNSMPEVGQTSKENASKKWCLGLGKNQEEPNWVLEETFDKGRLAKLFGLNKQ